MHLSLHQVCDYLNMVGKYDCQHGQSNDMIV